MPLLGDLEAASIWKVAVRILDLGGREVSLLHNGLLPAGPREMTWNGRYSEGWPAAAGIYFLRVETPYGSVMRKMVKLGPG